MSSLMLQQWTLTHINNESGEKSQENEMSNGQSFLGSAALVGENWTGKLGADHPVGYGTAARGRDINCIVRSVT